MRRAAFIFTFHARRFLVYGRPGCIFFRDLLMITYLYMYICVYVYIKYLFIYLWLFHRFLKGSFPHRRRKSPKPALVPLRGADRATSRRSHRVAGARVALALFVWLVMMMSGLLAVIRRKPLITRAIKCYEQKLSRSASHFERARGLWGLEKSQSRLSVSRSR